MSTNEPQVATVAGMRPRSWYISSFGSHVCTCEHLSAEHLRVTMATLAEDRPCEKCDCQAYTDRRPFLCSECRTRSMEPLNNYRGYIVKHDKGCSRQTLCQEHTQGGYNICGRPIKETFEDGQKLCGVHASRRHRIEKAAKDEREQYEIARWAWKTATERAAKLSEQLGIAVRPYNASGYTQWDGEVIINLDALLEVLDFDESDS